MTTEKNIENRKVGNNIKQLKIETIKNCLLARGLIYQKYLQRLHQSNHQKKNLPKKSLDLYQI